MHLAQSYAHWKSRVFSFEFPLNNQFRAVDRECLNWRIAMSALEAVLILCGVYLVSSLINVKSTVESVGMTVAFLVASAGTGWLRLFTQRNYQNHLQMHFRRALLQQLHDVALDTLSANRRDEWVGRLKKDLADMETFLIHRFPLHVGSLILLVFSLIVVFFDFSLRVALLMSVGVLVEIFLSLEMSRRLEQRNARRNRFSTDGEEIFAESCEGIRTIRSFGMEPYLQRRFDHLMTETLYRDSRVENKTRTLFALKDRIPLIAIATIVIVVSMMSSYEPQEILQVFLLSVVTFLSAEKVADGFIDLRKSQIPAERLADIFSAKREVPVTISGFDTLQAGKVGTLLMKDMVLETADGLVGPLTIRQARGQLNVLSGPSGAGKSSIMEILAGLRPAVSGSFRLEDTEGRLLWNMGNLRPRVPMAITAYVEQFPFIFEGTLRENLLFGNHQRLSDTVIWDMLESVALDETVKKQGGLDCEVKRRGKAFSKGERYRIALCRALLLRRPFLVLDEPFRHLDDNSMSMIIDTLRRQRSGTGIFIATRFIPKALRVDAVLTVGESTPLPSKLHTLAPPAV